MDNPFLATDAAVGNVVLDLDGVVFLGRDPIPGAGAALARLAASGWRVIFATNNATRTRDYVVDRISHTGYTPDPELVITSAIAASRLLSEADGPVYVVGEEGLRSTLRDAGVTITEDATDARCVVVALDRSFDYDRLAAASGAIRRGARYIATNSDVTFPTPDGQVPGAGSIVAAVTAAAGVEPTFAGKPHRPMIDAISAVLEPGETWMVGDRPETDLAIAHAAGWHSVLTLSGVTSDPARVPEEWSPDLVVDSLPDLIGQ